LAGRLRPVLGRLALAGAVVVAAVMVAGFGTVAWGKLKTQRPWFESAAVDEVHSAGAYVARHAPKRVVYYLFDMGARPNVVILGRWWHVVRASLPGDQVQA